MKSKINLFMNIGYICLVICFTILGVMMFHKHTPIAVVPKNFLGMIVGVVSTISIIFFGKAGILYFTAKLQRIAEDLKEGKCHWYAKPIDNKFLVFPLYPEESKLGNLTLVSGEKIQALLDEGKIDNAEVAKKVLSYLT